MEVFVCLVCLSSKETIERIYTPTKTKSPENRQNLATHTEVTLCDNTPGRAGWLLLVLALNSIRRECKFKNVKIYLDKFLLSVRCVLS